VAGASQGANFWRSVAAYLAFFQEQRAADDYKTSLRTVLTRMLIAPEFLHLVEVGQTSAGGRSSLLTAHELASRLSYLVWENMPDDTLLAAADSGALGRPDEVARQMTRMLSLPQARTTAPSFYKQWLGLGAFAGISRDSGLYPEFAAAKSDVLAGTLRFIDEALHSGGGDLKALFTGPYTFANARLGKLYNLGATGTELVRVEVDPRQRAGILTQPAVMATLGHVNESAPILRGAMILSQVLCSPPPPPPDDVADQVAKTAKTIPKTSTTRQYTEALTQAAACSGCHAIINPVGFGFEGYDAIGAWRATDKGLPVDDSGSLSVGDTPGPFSGAAELGQKLAASKTVEACLVRQWFRYAFRRVETEGDGVILADLERRFKAAGGKLLALPELLAQTDAFYRVHFTTGAAQ
jgi:hypothetical protein